MEIKQQRLEIPGRDFFLQHQNFSSLNKSLENPYLVAKKVTEFFTSFWSSRSSSRFWIVGCFSGISAQRNSEVWLKSIREDGNEQCNLRMQKSPPRCIKTTVMHKESSQPGIFVENVWQHFVAAVKLHLSLWGATCIPRWGTLYSFTWLEETCHLTNLHQSTAAPIPAG